MQNLSSCKIAENLQRLGARAKKLTFAAQQRHKRYYDAKHTAMHFAVNDEVLLSTVGLHLRVAGINKLAPRWVAPSKIIERIGNVAFGLDLAVTMKIHAVFQVFLLNRHHREAAFSHHLLLTSLMMSLSGVHV